MGDSLDLKNVTIESLEPGSLMVLGWHVAMSQDEVEAEIARFNDLPVPGLQDWMREVPRRWFN